MVLLHGWTGDETVMWVFTHRLPQNLLMIAPRGLYSAPTGGYSWTRAARGSWPTLDDFRPAAAALDELLSPAHFPSANFSQLFLTGFSQGAALTYAFALLYPQRVSAFAGLAGFMPEAVDDVIAVQPLYGKPAFVSHGTRDELVPVEQARWAVKSLEQAGARVAYCEEDVGHKLAADCFRGLGAFFRSQAPGA
jgi:phospholipase/carboxylesterase